MPPQKGITGIPQVGEGRVNPAASTPSLARLPVEAPLLAGGEAPPASLPFTLQRRCTASPILPSRGVAIQGRRRAGRRMAPGAAAAAEAAPALRPREAGSVSVPPREQLLRAMAEAAATGRAPRFFQRLPKVELHAHLNGSISDATMKKLMAQKPDLGIQKEMVVIDKGTKRTLEECFQMFQFIHQMTSRPEDILMVTKDVVREFAADGVKYLELRSTPREERSTGMTKRTYLEAVLEGIKQCKEEGLDIDVRFLVSVDRSKGAAAAKETVKLAEDFLLSTDGLVLGLDFSGNPKAGRGQDFLEPLLEAKKAGLKLTLHLSEIPKQEDESRLLLGLSPDRIGHGTFLQTSELATQDLVELVRRNRTPLELCLTSNLKAETVASKAEHHFGFWYRLGHPVVLCTDDKGVFATELSREYQMVAETFQLSDEQTWALSSHAIDHIFASSHTKTRLKEQWRALKPALLEELRPGAQEAGGGIS